MQRRLVQRLPEAALVTLLLCGAARSAVAATVFVAVGGNDPYPDNVVIIAGDAVVWQNAGAGPFAVVRSYTGAWPPASLTTDGATFTNVFKEPGYFPYRTWVSLPQGSFPDGGSVTVLALSSAPPVMLNAPIEGHYPLSGVVFEASPREATNVANIDFLVGTNLVGTATNFAYLVTYYPTSAGQYVVQARLTDLAGKVSSSAPVTISVDDTFWLYGLRRLPNGEFLIRYSTALDAFSVLYGLATNSVPTSYIGHRAWGFTRWLRSYGTIIDETARASPMRFYFVEPGP
jgi:hypothetical protein